MQEPNKEFLTLAEVAEYVGLKRASLYYYINGLGIEIHKFNLSNRAHISLADAKRIKEIKEKPWLAGNKDKTKKKRGEEPAA